MPISGTTTDYSGRALDIGILQYPTPTTGGGPVQLAFGNPSNFVAGIQKLVQRYAVLFLTELGSQQYYPAFGTDFYASITSSSQITNVGAQHVFNFANLIVSQTFKTWQADNPSTFLDEQFDSATLLSFVVVNNTASLSIQITSLAGSVVQFILPLPEPNV